MIDNTLNPDFVRKFILDYFFEEKQNLRFDVWVIPSDPVLRGHAPFLPHFSIFPLFLPEFDLLRLLLSLRRSFFPVSHLISPNSPPPLLLLSAAQLLPEELFIGACLNSHSFKGERYKDRKYFIWSFIPNLPAAKQSKYLNWIVLKIPPLLSPTAYGL